MLFGCDCCGKVQDFSMRYTFNDFQLCVHCYGAYKERDKTKIALPPKRGDRAIEIPKWQMN